MALMRVARERLQIIVSGCGGAIALLGAVAFGASALVSGAVFLAGFLFGPMVPVAFSYAARHAPRVQGPLIGIANLLVSLGAGIALPLAGALGDLTSLRVALSLMFALPLLGAAAFWLGTQKP